MDTVYSLFKQVVEANKDRPAIIENNRTMTFDELSNMVDMIACSFPEKIHSIGIVMRHRAEMIASILAVLKCGGRYVPAEPTFPTGRIHDMMEEAQVDFILTEHAFAQKLDGFPLRFADCEICGVETPSWKRNAAEDPSLPAYVLYTSGTTGRPKGVCVTNANVCHYVRAFEDEFHSAPGDIMLQFSACPKVMILPNWRRQTVITTTVPYPSADMQPVLQSSAARSSAAAAYAFNVRSPRPTTLRAGAHTS